ncbi:hypothetical protein OAA67_00980 [Winogradskyella sp.]|nr:hypothetical protein [Winogradskyella sp.]MDB9782908.1 hypothetical protein [Winogradskyella sp.]MDC1504136.1 hypothetical protein [Winogradskyella sp.]
MENLEFPNEESLSKFHQDVLWWKLNIQFVETEILFINRLINSAAFEQDIPNLFEQLDKFKHQIKTETRALENLKEDVNNHDGKMQNMAECEDLFCDAVYLKNHDTLKIHFERFFKSFGELKSKIFNYTGSILKNT